MNDLWRDVCLPCGLQSLVVGRVPHVRYPRVNPSCQGSSAWASAPSGARIVSPRALHHKGRGTGHGTPAGGRGSVDAPGGIPRAARRHEGLQPRHD
jgi:hypothetical protein